MARCRLSLIRGVGFVGRIRRVATRYPRLASRYLSRSQGVEVVALILLCSSRADRRVFEKSPRGGVRGSA